MGIKIYYIIFFCPFFLFAQIEKTSKLDVEKIIHLEKDTGIFKSISFFNKNKRNKNKYNLALLLPFCVDKNDLSLNLDSVIQSPEQPITNFYQKSIISIDFLLGFLMSLEKFQDVEFEVSLFDIQEGDTSKIILQELIDTQYLRNFDLIIGPLFSDNFLFFSDNFYFDVPIISPFSKQNHITANNSNTIQIQSKLENKISVFSDFIFNNHIEDNILFIQRDTLFDIQFKRKTDNKYETLIDTVIPEDIYLSNFFLNNVDTTNLNFERIKVSSNVIDSIHHKLDTLGMKNIIIISSEDNVFVTDLLSKLHATRDTGMVVYALPTLFDFDHVPIVDLMDMKVTFPFSKFDYDSRIDTFLIDFHNRYNYVPKLKYTVVGYEIGLYFLEILSSNDKILSSLSELESKRVLETIYDFKKTMFGGYENQGMMILRYDDFGYKRIY